MNFVQFLTVFIVAYLMWFIMRWFVLPHLRIFPYIPPMWLWTSLYGIFVYVMNWLFTWILLYLIICYVSWKVILAIIPDFPIPLQSILLDMAPWKPLLEARVLQFMDELVKVFVSADSIKKRAWRAGNSTANFLKSSFFYIQKEIGFRSGKDPVKPNAEQTVKPPSNEKYSNDTGRKDPQPKRRNAVRRSTRPSPFENDEMKQIQDEYLQCVEENSVPVYPGQGLETAQAIVKNKSASSICMLNMMKTYNNLMFNRA